MSGWQKDVPSKLFLQSYACLLGIWQLAEPPVPCREVLMLPELRPLNICFETEAYNILRPIWTSAWPKT
jgi:hypothetical protein